MHFRALACAIFTAAVFLGMIPSATTAQNRWLVSGFLGAGAASAGHPILAGGYGIAIEREHLAERARSS